MKRYKKGIVAVIILIGLVGWGIIGFRLAKNKLISIYQEGRMQTAIEFTDYIQAQLKEKGKVAINLQEQLVDGEIQTIKLSCTVNERITEEESTQ